MSLIIEIFGAVPNPSVWTWSPGTLESISTALGALATGGAALWAATVAARRFSLEQVAKDRAEADAAREVQRERIEADEERVQQMLTVEREEREKDRRAETWRWRRFYANPAGMSDDDHEAYTEEQRWEHMTAGERASEMADMEGQAQSEAEDEGR